MKSALMIAVLGWAGTLLALPTQIVVQDTPRQDPLSLPTLVHELGYTPLSAYVKGPFPLEEGIEIVDCVPWQGARSCPADYLPQAGPDFLVSIRNLSNTPWTNLHYVADIGTSITNDDGLINDGLAFRIDNVGLNQPLVSESLSSDLVFQPGETWAFILQNYAGAGSPYAFASIGVGSGSSGVADGSSGSIIAIPEPGLLGLLVIGGLTLLRKRTQWRIRSAQIG